MGSHKFQEAAKWFPSYLLWKVFLVYYQLTILYWQHIYSSIWLFCTENKYAIQLLLKLLRPIFIYLHNPPQTVTWHTRVLPKNIWICLVPYDFILHSNLNQTGVIVWLNVYFIHNHMWQLPGAYMYCSEMRTIMTTAVDWI